MVEKVDSALVEKAERSSDSMKKHKRAYDLICNTGRYRACDHKYKTDRAQRARCSSCPDGMVCVPSKLMCGAICLPPCNMALCRRCLFFHVCKS